MKSIFRHKYLIFSFIIISLLASYLYFIKKQPLLWGYHEFYFTPKKYLKKIEQLELEKANPSKNTKELFLSHFKQLLPFWYGTRYSFFGQTKIPGEGAIACGYFVTTVLENLGIKLDRNRLAQLASEEMIKELVNKELIQRYSGISINEFLENIKHSGTGLYIVGLDTHTGFILFENSDIWFIHASGSFPFAVVKETASQSKSLAKSKYRIFGKISDDKKIIENWLD